jgi:hypothetical protein
VEGRGVDSELSNDLYVVGINASLFRLYFLQNSEVGLLALYLRYM